MALIVVVIVVIVLASERRPRAGPGASRAALPRRTVIHGVRAADTFLAPEPEGRSDVLPPAPHSDHTDGQRCQSVDGAHAGRTALVGLVTGFRRVGPAAARPLQRAGCGRCLLLNTVPSDIRVCMVSRLVRTS